MFPSQSAPLVSVARANFEIFPHRDYRWMSSGVFAMRCYFVANSVYIMELVGPDKG